MCSALIDLDRAIARGDLPAGGRARSVGAYELHERIGEGSFAVVHRATQTSLGREVAVKVIRAELANRPEFIRRFEAEAQMVARIEHPNVVPLYDYWREPGRAFLVMRWMTGGSLAGRLDHPWSLDAIVGLVDQVAAGLDAVREAGVVHRDVRPENILFDAEGRAYLGDFGIAFDTEDGPPSKGDGPEADVRALAIVAQTLLSKGQPFDAERVDAVLAVATAPRPAERYPTTPDFARALRAVADTTGAAPSAPTPQRRRVNPYKGLRAFDESDAADFHGRDRLVTELVTHLDRRDTRLLAVVGPSGSGKSSVVRAGLVPALRDGRAEGSSQWFLTTMTPGSRPFEALETALLRVAVNPPNALLDQLRDGERGLLRGIKRIVPDDRAVVAVVIDQFEELFTAEVPDGDRDLFLRSLTVAATEAGSPVRFVLTLRADFYDRPLRHAHSAPVFKTNTVPVTPLAPDELEQAIVAPAATVGVGFEPRLVAEIIADVDHQPGALPVLQYALTQAFVHSDGVTIRIGDCRSIGGLTGAVGRRAEELWLDADAPERAATRRLFGRLIQLGQGTEDTRRRVPVAEIGDDPATRAAIERYGEARLLTVDRAQATREPTVEVAHEALIRDWPRLREWLDDDRDTLRTHRHLTAAAAGWIESDRDPSELYRGARLENVVQLRSSGAVALNQREAEFLDASTDRRNEEAAAEQRRIRRLHRLVAATALVAVLALVAGAVAFWQRQRSQDVADAAETARLVATAQSLAPTKPREAMLLAVAANQRERSPATVGALQATLSQAGPFLGYLGWGTEYLDVAWLPNGRLVGVRADGLDLYARDSARLLDSVDLDIGRGPRPGRSETSRGAAGGSDVFAVAAGATVHVFSATDRFEPRFDQSMPAPVAAVGVAPDGRTIVATSMDGTVAAWSEEGETSFAPLEVPLHGNLMEQFDAHIELPVALPEVLRDPFENAPVYATPVAHEDHIHLQTGAVTETIDYEGKALTQPVYTFVDVGGGVPLPATVRELFHPDPDETVLVGAGAIGRLSHDVGAPAIARLTVPAGTIGLGSHPTIHSYLDREGRPLSLLDDGTLVRFDPDTGARLDARDLGIAPALSAVSGPEPGTLAVASAQGIAIVATDGAGPITRAVARQPHQSFLSLSHDGRFVVLAGPPGPPRPFTVYERDTVQGGYRALTDFPISTAVAATTVTGHAGAHMDGIGVWVPAAPGSPRSLTVHSFRLDTPDAPLLTLSLPIDAHNTGDQDPRLRWTVGDSVATQEIHVIDLQSGALVERLPLPPGTRGTEGPSGIRFDPSGARLLVSSSSGQSQIYDTETWTPLDDDVLADEDIVAGTWNTDGSLLATASSNGQITVRDGDTLATIRDMVGAGGAFNAGHGGRMVFSHDNTVLLTDHDNVARLWDVATGQQLGIDMPTAKGTNSAVNIGDTLQLLTATDDGALIWNLDTEGWADIACATAGSNLTVDEWRQWGPRDEDHRAICDEFPLPS